MLHRLRSWQSTVSSIGTSGSTTLEGWGARLKDTAGSCAVDPVPIELCLGHCWCISYGNFCTASYPRFTVTGAGVPTYYCFSGVWVIEPSGLMLYLTYTWNCYFSLNDCLPKVLVSYHQSEPMGLPLWLEFLCG